jgi:hypothetical protein
MRITLTLDDALVEQVRKIAAERNTTLAALVSTHLEQLAAEHADRKRRELEELQRTFDRFQFRLGKKTWRREDLYERS